MTEEEMQEVFREMREEPIPADSLARVRAGVHQRLEKRSWVSPWTIVAALALAGFVVGAFLSLRPSKAVQQISPPEIAQVLQPAASPVHQEAPAPRGVRPRRARPKLVESVPVSIRIETPDPDVVILLVN